MKSEQEIFRECELICRIFDGNMDPEKMRAFEKSLSRDPELLAIYAQVAEVHGHLICPGVSLGLTQQPSGDEDAVLSAELWQQLLEYEKAAPEIDLHKEEPQEKLIQKVVYPEREKRKMSTFSIVFLAMNAAAVLFIVLFLQFAPSKRGVEIATLTDSINAKWADVIVQEGERLKSDSSSLMLREGVVELLFDNHTKVVVEAPAEFELISKDQINLRYGRLYTMVPKEAIGFSIYTPNARVIDLGTEFGINAEAHGDTFLHVIKGKTVLIAGDRFNKDTVEVVEGFAKKVSSNQEISDIRCDDRLFIRDIQSEKNVIWRGQRELSLSDIVGAGNGLGTGTIENSIDPLTGNMTHWAFTPERAGNGEYISVSTSDYIDGVFVPDGSNGPVVVTSQGDTWECPRTSNAFKYNIVNSLQIPRDLSPYQNYVGDIPKTDVILNKASQGDVPLQTMGVMSKQYRRNPTDETVFMHANLGITFDLWKVRKIFPELTQVKKFQSVFGAGEIALESQSFDVWVLVDGKPVFVQQDMNSRQMLEIDISLTNEDRFLSLVVTEGSDEFSYYNDWGVFVNPHLVVE